MIFCGDTVFPKKYSSTIIENLGDDFLKKQKIVNFESLIEVENMVKTTKGIGLSSSEDVLPFFKALNITSCSQSNNHITDFDTSIDNQKKILAENDIESFGAGDTLSSAAKPFIYLENEKKHLVIAFGWDVIGCQYATSNNKGVNPFDHEYIFDTLNKFKTQYEGHEIILCFHNNYEFELYPQPAHRKMFFDFINAGASAIFCHHPHIAGGCEIYKNKPIFYSLGNFYLPETNYNGYELRYSDNAKKGLCVEYSSSIEKIKLYWTYKDENNILHITKKEGLLQSKKINALTPFDGLNHSDYITWFKNNRKKNKLLPIYKNYESLIEKNINDFLVSIRQKAIDLLVRANLKRHSRKDS